MIGADDAFDVVIVGASFAGLVAARTAAMAGLRVAVIEAKTSAGARVATTGILVKEAAEEIDLPHDLTRRVHGVRLYAPNLTHTDLFAPGYYFLTTRTGPLLDWLAREALRAGARLYFGSRFAGAERDGNLLRIGGYGITARYIIGADGGHSRVAEVFGLGANRCFLTGVEAEYEGLQGVDQRFLHCFIDSKLAPGYLAWVAPGPAVTQVGLATHEWAKPNLTAFQQHTARLFDYADGQIVERRAGRIPAGGLVHPLGAPGVLLIGDAAGMVSPLTGGGIRLAFHFGRRAARAVADHLLHLGPPPETVMAAELPSFGLKKLMRAGLDLAPHNGLINLLIGTAPMQAMARYVYFHRRGGSGLTPDEFWRRILESERGQGARLDALPKRPLHF